MGVPLTPKQLERELEEVNPIARRAAANTEWPVDTPTKEVKRTNVSVQRLTDGTFYISSTTWDEWMQEWEREVERTAPNLEAAMAIVRNFLTS